MSTLILAILGLLGLLLITIAALFLAIWFGGSNSSRPTVADIQARLDGEDR